jgi:hypothetical protein
MNAITMNAITMNTTAINNCVIGKDAPVSIRAIIQVIYMLYLFTYYIMIYSCILMVNYMITEEKEKREEVTVAGLSVASLDDDNIGFLKPDEVVDEVRSSNEVENDDMETLYIYEFEGTGEQLRRLRAYNPILADETDDEYTSRIWSMAYKEDEEKEAQKVLSANEVVNEVVNEVLEPLENDVNTWYTIEDGKCRYKGEWKNGLPNGKGIKHFYKTDSYIDGNFVDGFAEGHCKQTFEQTWEKTVPYYEGEFKRNNYQGKGEYHYGDGDYYKGMWKDGKYHGHGVAYSKRINRTWIGEYDNDKKVEGNWVKGEI